MTVSIVIPVYNVEKYLNKCINTVINQSFKDLEILLVDDGSTDNSGKICDEFALTDNRIKVIHKANGGLSDARNVGIENATSEWITFIDSDDYVSEDYVEYLFQLVNQYNADISIATFTYVTNNKKIEKSTGSVYVMNTETALKRMLMNDGFDMGAWGKMYRTKYFIDIKYPVGKLFEDSGTTYKLVDKATKIVFGSKPIYFYINRDDSIVNSTFNPRKLDLIEMNLEMMDFIKQFYPEIESAAKRRVLWAYFSTLNQVVSSKNKKTISQFAPPLVKYIKENKYFFKNCKELPKRDRIAFFILDKFGLRVYSYSWNIYLKMTK